ncbi:MAG: class I SAM-dependent methyltransferase [Phycisphaerales bacterium]
MDPHWETATPYYSRSGLHIEVYDRMEWPANGPDVSFIVELAGETGGPVLELASGTGRVAWAVAEAGLDVMGLDLHPGMIEAAEAKRSGYAGLVGDRVGFVQGDMTDFDLGKRFKLVYITFRSFQALLTSEMQRDCLRRVWRHLEPGGRLMINIFDPRLTRCDAGFSEPVEEQTLRNPVTGMEVEHRSIERMNDPFSQTLKMLWVLRERDGVGNVVREEYERLDLRWTYRQEMRYLLELCGFEVEAEYSDFEKSPPACGKEQVWVARKVGEQEPLKPRAALQRA